YEVRENSLRRLLADQSPRTVEALVNYFRAMSPDHVNPIEGTANLLAAIASVANDRNERAYNERDMVAEVSGVVQFRGHGSWIEVRVKKGNKVIETFHQVRNYGDGQPSA